MFNGIEVSLMKLYRTFYSNRFLPNCSAPTADSMGYAHTDATIIKERNTNMCEIHQSNTFSTQMCSAHADFCALKLACHIIGPKGSLTSATLLFLRE
jgi:hypothetical protein